MELSPLVVQTGEIEKVVTVQERIELPGQLISSLARAYPVKLRKKGSRIYLDGQVHFQGLYQEDSTGMVAGFQRESRFKCLLDEAGAELTLQDIFVRNELPRETRTGDKVFRLEVPVLIAAYPRLTCEQNPTLYSLPHVVFHNPQVCTLDEIVASNTIHTLVDTLISIPPERPAAGSVVQVTAQVKNISCQVVANQVNVTGTVEENIVLSAADQPGHLFSLVRDVGFSASIPLPGVQPGMLVTVFPVVLKATGALVDSRTVKTSIELSLTARVKAHRQVELAADITGPTAGVTEVICPGSSGAVGGVTEITCPPSVVSGAGEVCCQPLPGPVAGVSEVVFPVSLPGTRQLRVENIVFQGQVQTLVKGTLTIPLQKPEAEKVLSVSGNPVITELRCLTNKLVIQGFLPVRVVYVALLPSQPVHAFDDRLRFTTFIDLPGLRPGIRVQVQPVLEFIKATVNESNPRLIDIVAIVQLLVRAFEPRSGFLIS